MSIQTRSNEEIHNYFEKNSCILHDNYVNSFTKMKYTCRCGRETSTNWNHFLRGQRCGYCSTTGRKHKYSIDEVKLIFLERGCYLQEDLYIDNKNIMKYICKCGNESKISLSAFVSQNQYCRICAAISRSGVNNVNWIPDRLQKDKNDLLRKKCLGYLYRAIKRADTLSGNKVIPVLKYSPNDLLQSLNVSKIDFKIYGLDHIFPLQAFIDYNISDISLINSLDNLKLIPKRENFKKGHKYNREEFLNWLQKKDVNGF